jgi:hypothetical protein
MVQIYAFYIVNASFFQTIFNKRVHNVIYKEK